MTRDENYQKVQVCKDFARTGKCEYAVRCKYAHPGSQVSVTPGDVLVCQDVAKTGACKRENCKHYHPFEGQELKSSSAYLEVCREFFLGAAKCDRQRCTYAHPSVTCAMPLFVDLCLNFILGKCLRDDCKFYHDIEGRVDHGNCKDYPNCSRGDQCLFTHPGDSKRRSEDIILLERPAIDASRNCLDFFHGSCTRGDTCRFEHVAADGRTVSTRVVPVEPPPPPPSAIIGRQAQPARVDSTSQCLNFFHGRCSRGLECKFAHGQVAHFPMDGIVADRERECIDFVHGRCARDDCKFSHGEIRRESRVTLAKKPRLSDRDRGAAASLAKAVDPVSECLDFFHNRCTRGSDCKFKHMAAHTGKAVHMATFADPSRECLQFFYGRCTRGNDCKFQHSSVQSVNVLTTSRHRIDRSRSRGRRRDRSRSRNRSRDRGRHLERARSRGRRDLGHERRRKVSPPRHHSRRVERSVLLRTDFGKKPTLEVCKEFLVGKCVRYDCKFVHDPFATCPEFQRGYCSRGSTCLLSHKEECHDYMHGKCTRGDSCRFSHNPASILIKNR
eukprot:GEMP01044638.1.p1 GENE.GEMP01044638.1~~GEMP01044638.1.p1  ORF type:complete len:556 (+),score=117.12 GEMP01044638.1:86-1753(+)